jgi:hypothetical protein
MSGYDANIKMILKGTGYQDVDWINGGQWGFM